MYVIACQKPLACDFVFSHKFTFSPERSLFMKRFFILIFSLRVFLCPDTVGQALPLDEKTGKTVYTEVIAVNGVSQKELYRRALNWFKTYFPSPSSVLKEQDTVSCSITGQHGIYIFKTLQKGEQFKSGQVRYTLKVQAKEGRYKYQIDDIFKVATPKVYIEEWLDEKAPDREVRAGYIRQVDTHIRDVIAKLKEAMAKPVKPDAGNDW